MPDVQWAVEPLTLARLSWLGREDFDVTVLDWPTCDEIPFQMQDNQIVVSSLARFSICRMPGRLFLLAGWRIN